jgi:hypothetical protein
VYPSLKIAVSTFLISVFVTGAALAADEPQYSGFLGDEVYAKLELVEIRKGTVAQRWVGPKLNFANYKSILVDDVVLYPKPQPGPQVSAETLKAIQDYVSEKLTMKVGSVLNLADGPGSQVLRLQAAITGVEIKTEGMKAYEIVPVAAIFGGLKAATGKRDREVRVFVEAKFTDSVTGELVGAAVRRIEGEKLKGKKDQLSLEDMQENLDSAADDAKNTLDKVFSDK